ncbi:unnamed protein product [Bathycoccus prasinos]
MPGYEIMRNITGVTGVKLNKKFPFWPPLLVEKDVRVKVWRRRHGDARHWFEKNNREDAFDHQQEMIWAHSGARQHDDNHPYRKDPGNRPDSWTSSDDDSYKKNK